MARIAWDKVELGDVVEHFIHKLPYLEDNRFPDGVSYAERVKFAEVIKLALPYYQMYMCSAIHRIVSDRISTCDQELADRCILAMLTMKRAGVAHGTLGGYLYLHLGINPPDSLYEFWETFADRLIELYGDDR